MAEWKQMDSAPKDGTTIIVFMGKQGKFTAGIPMSNMVFAHWSGWGGGVWENSTSGGKLNEPLCWKPRPAEPLDCYAKHEGDERIVVIEQ